MMAATAQAERGTATDDEIEAKARAYLGPKAPGIPWEVYYHALASQIFTIKQMQKGLRHRNGRWVRLKEGQE